MSKKKLAIPPKNEARPLGTKRPKPSTRSKKSSALTLVPDPPSVEVALDAPMPVVAEQAAAVPEIACTDNAPAVTSLVSSPRQALTPNPRRMNLMDIELTRDDNKRASTLVVYKNPNFKRVSVRISKSAFTDKTAPETLIVSSDSFAQPKPKLTPEERKALRANRPKLTAAEKLQRAEARLAKLKEQAEKESTAAVAL